MSPDDLSTHHEQDDDGASFPRHGAGDDDGPALEAMKAGRSRKGSWANLRGSVQRFLLSRLERPWDDTIEELLSTFGASGIPRRLLQQRLPDLVELDVIEEDGELLRRDPRTLRLSPLSAPSTQRTILYVCPSTRLLRRHVPGDTRNRIQLSEWSLVRQLGKRWYQLTLAPIPATPPRRVLLLDAVLRCPVDHLSPQLTARLARLYGREGVFAQEKRQVGKAELARLRAGTIRACR